MDYKYINFFYIFIIVDIISYIKIKTQIIRD